MEKDRTEKMVQDEFENKEWQKFNDGCIMEEAKEVTQEQIDALKKRRGPDPQDMVDAIAYFMATNVAPSFGARRFVITDKQVNKLLRIMGQLENILVLPHPMMELSIELLKEMQEVPYAEAGIQGGQ